jgi:hypothetical protein
MMGRRCFTIVAAEMMGEVRGEGGRKLYFFRP